VVIVDVYIYDGVERKMKGLPDAVYPVVGLLLACHSHRFTGVLNGCVSLLFRRHASPWLGETKTTRKVHSFKKLGNLSSKFTSNYLSSPLLQESMSKL
jgi:hypothetical protein